MANDATANPNDAELYDASFFDAITPTAQAAARVLMPMVLEFVRPRRVVDVGCGRGGWVSVLAELAECQIVGVDGPYVDPRHLVIPRECFVSHDLNERLPELGVFDLTICMEVAEHLKPERATSFVADLCRLAPTVLFSAAIPGQGGTGHINEQWQSYWVELFSAQGYSVVDVLRPAIWEDQRIPWCYRQNLMFFTRDTALAAQHPAGIPADLVHPEVFGMAVAARDAVPGVGDHLRDLWPAVRRSIAFRMRRLRRP